MQYNIYVNFKQGIGPKPSGVEYPKRVPSRTHWQVGKYLPDIAFNIGEM